MNFIFEKVTQRYTEKKLHRDTRRKSYTEIHGEKITLRYTEKKLHRATQRFGDTQRGLDSGFIEDKLCFIQKA